LEIAYLLGNWKMVYANQPDEGATSIVQFGTPLPSLDQWCNCGRVPNTPKWQAIFEYEFHKSFLPLVKKLPIFEYK
jgi:hypothetical protein